MKIIFDYNRTIFDPETDALYQGVLELLQKLSATYELFLISRNEPTRKKRLAELNIENYFQKISFVDEKSEQVFEEIIGKTKDVVKVSDIDVRNYAKYILRDETIAEKRELLTCLRSKILMSEKQIMIS